MKKILVFNFNWSLLHNDEDFEFVSYFDETVDYIITEDITYVSEVYRSLVLRNIAMVNYDVKRSVELYEIGLKIQDYCIISSNCMAGFFNQYTCNKQKGPCAFWRYDPMEFYLLLMQDKEEFLNSFITDIKFFERNGHYYAKDNYRTISFNHYKNKSSEEVREIYIKRMQDFDKTKTIIVLGLDRHSFTYDEVLNCALKYPEAIIVTNYDITMENVFSYNNTDEQFYLKCMQFLVSCDLDKLNSLLPKDFNQKKIVYDKEQTRLFNLIVMLSDDVKNKREQLKILSKRIKSN